MNEALKKILDNSIAKPEADFLNSIFGRFCHEAINGTMPVVLFGAGSAGRELHACLKLHGVHPVCFCDNSASLPGSSYCGIPVISFDDMKKEQRNALIFITTTKYFQEILKQLLASGFKADHIFYTDHNKLSYYAQFFQWHYELKDLQKNQEKLLEVHNMLADQKSRDLFISRIGVFALGADYKSYRAFIKNYAEAIAKGRAEIPREAKREDQVENYLYFNNDIICLKDGEVLVDGGAYDGDSTNEFIKACDKQLFQYKKIFCFEPDPSNYRNLLKTTSRTRSVKCQPKGLWSHASVLRFVSSSQIESLSPRIVRDTGDIEIISPRAGDIEINTISVDELLLEEEITFVKMDIEGAEIEAIRGAAKTIARYKPKLAISVYHKSSDIYEIPLLVHKICPGYKLYLRHFSNNFTETVLLATV